MLQPFSSLLLILLNGNTISYRGLSFNIYLCCTLQDTTPIFSEHYLWASDFTISVTLQSCFRILLKLASFFGELWDITQPIKPLGIGSPQYLLYCKICLPWSSASHGIQGLRSSIPHKDSRSGKERKYRAWNNAPFLWGEMTCFSRMERA